MRGELILVVDPFEGLGRLLCLKPLVITVGFEGPIG